MDEYEDYIVNTPERAKILPEEIYYQAKEHTTILRALTHGNMTVKEIHELYMLPNGKYSKTLKTIYRYLEILDQLKLVMVAGHRKYEGKRTLEKLYCRTAKIFFTDDPSKKERWLETDEGKQYLDIITDTYWALSGKKEGDKSELYEIIKKHFIQQHKYNNQMIHKIMEDKELSDQMDQYNFDQIGYALDAIPMFQTVIENCDDMKRIKEILS